jgi:3-hydroxyisobutyrate dehydrogenase-like beta-hydroxyacid dehydrogenase
MRIGFIGAGRMGRPMVARLVETGHDVAVLGRSVEKRAAIAQLGASPVARTAEVSARADVVVVCVFTDEQVQQVCLDDGLLATMPPGSALVVHTTGSPRTVETIAVRAAPHDVDVVDAPVSGGPHNAAAGALTLFVGGAGDAVTRVRPVLSCYGDPVLHVGPLGAGQKVKLVNNALFAAHIGLLSGAVELGARLGVPESALLNALPHGSAASRVLDIVAAGESVASFIDTVGEFVGKDVAVVRSIATELGSDLGVLDGVIGAAMRV